MVLYYIIALQLQCGVQQIQGQSLHYGTLIFQQSPESSPQLAYFENIQDHFEAHPFCVKLQERMNNGMAIHIHLDTSGKKIVGLPSSSL